MAPQTQAGGSTATSQQALMTTTTVSIPRIAIKFCTQCKWNLRAAYLTRIHGTQYAQELLQTFGTSIGEIALVPATGGIFTVTMTHAATTTELRESGSHGSNGSGEQPTTTAAATVTATDTILWDRKTDGGFPETKELKSRVRNIIEPGRDLGHIDRSLKKGKTSTSTQEESQADETVKSSGASGADGLDQEKTATGSGSGSGGGDEEQKGAKEKSKTKDCEDCN
ncbi:hypothetical protein PV08_04155 [Exophiala spinifera]|uniref:Selenoprotein W-like protein n=1 Tax=Exophiala spinifera TaxID=91928 RepID=A0A0D2C052_9EURO|nr:uncharacterized protein PV08_04155 [Exophiala spinifera]KIW16964.1 hypothetical protein PV08_04155 [Exophiala spinifera]